MRELLDRNKSRKELSLQGTSQPPQPSKRTRFNENQINSSSITRLSNNFLLSLPAPHANMNANFSIAMQNTSDQAPLEDSGLETEFSYHSVRVHV